MANRSIQNPYPGQFNSVQLNVVTVIDVAKAVRNESLNDTLYMMDNSVGGEGQGTAHLTTVCKPGQVINWLIYPIDKEKKADGTWPPMPKINNIVFLQENEHGHIDGYSEKMICSELKIYGGPDKVRSLKPMTPVYYYWAGMVLHDLEPGIYPYRLVLELEQNTPPNLFLNTMDKLSPSLHVIPMDEDYPSATETNVIANKANSPSTGAVQG